MLGFLYASFLIITKGASLRQLLCTLTDITTCTSSVVQPLYANTTEQYLSSTFRCLLVGKQKWKKLLLLLSNGLSISQVKHPCKERGVASLFPSSQDWNHLRLTWAWMEWNNLRIVLDDFPLFLRELPAKREPQSSEVFLVIAQGVWEDLTFEYERTRVIHLSLAVGANEVHVSSPRCSSRSGRCEDWVFPARSHVRELRQVASLRWRSPCNECSCRRLPCWMCYTPVSSDQSNLNSSSKMRISFSGVTVRSASSNFACHTET